ncbi:hypothetical protein HK099_005829 [Clydaea vesicula]|uniref:Uncharacterized protein n=1 Tax=Clydaea vesicula TaxID=447962 RepID=A0AAD5XXC0_9FUNG|nr:hypothetical protein HK099_005829 [Clydaea vesicula]
MVVSGAGAIANGLCYYSYYADWYSLSSQTAAAAIADVLWLLQESGNAFYGYMVVKTISNKPKKKKIYYACFWVVFALVAVFRLMILIRRNQLLNNVFPDDADRIQQEINMYHSFYFCFIALLELVNAVFLVSDIVLLRKESVKASLSIYNVICKSSEIRASSLVFIGVARAITYLGQQSAQSASNEISQLDRFVYTLEVLYPFVMIMDILLLRINTAKAKSNNDSTHKKTVDTVSATQKEKDHNNV